MCFGFSPCKELVISGLVPTGFSPHVEAYCRTLVRIFSKTVRPGRLVDSGVSATATGAPGGSGVKRDAVMVASEPSGSSTDVGDAAIGWLAAAGLGRDAFDSDGTSSAGAWELLEVDPGGR